MTTFGHPGDPEDPTLDLRVAQQAGMVPTLRIAGLPGAEPDGRTDSPAGAAPVAAADLPTRRVSGKVYDELGLPASGLDIAVYHVGFQCDGQRLGVTDTGPDGGYSLAYQRDGVVNLQVRAISAAGQEVALSKVKHRAGDAEIINLVCPAAVRPRATEHARLLGDLAGHLGRGNLADASEDGPCRDITLLSRASGWDARLVALAAHAQRLSAQTGAPAEGIYALLRVGLPADARQLAGLKASTLDSAFARAIQAGLAQLSTDDMAKAKQALAGYARQLRLNGPAAPGTLSSIGELLATSGLSQEEAERFDAIVAAHDGPPAQLWEKAREVGISPEKVGALRTQGKLAQLTGNNAPLMSALRDEIGREPMGRAMVARDLHTPQAWLSYLKRMSAQVPPAYEGDDEAQRLEVYAEDLARKVRIGLPTHVIARRAERGEFNLPGAEGVAQVLYRAADELGFRFGTTPTRTFLKKNPQLLSGVADPQATEAALATMHRVYQITPDDHAMKVLIDTGATSAHVISSMSEQQFSDGYTQQLGPAITSLIYRKSVLVSSVAYNAFAAAQTLASTPVMYAVSPSPDVITQAQQNIMDHFPTMAGLFGELDFCECDHCRSVLSPAAYLVDLLSFVDPPDNLWELIRQSPSEPKPFQVLTQRRPDLPLLPLTCENTHTVLPYVDVVNEILEFSVAHQGADLPAFDVGQAESDDLIAEPQNLIAEAYPILRDATYPLGLPFDLWLETVRAFLDRLDAPLATVLAQLCQVSTLDGVPYGRREVHREELGLSPAEYALFAAGTTDWHRLYGYPDAGTARTQLAKAKTLAGRLGVSYKELAELVTTWFANPQLDALVLLRSLDLDAWELMRYMNASGVPPFNAGERAAFETKAGPHLTWLVTSYTGGGFDQIVVLADSNTSCSFEHTTLRFLNSAEPLDEVLTRLNLLVRLQRRLGWKLSEVDASLRALLPVDALGPALEAVLVSLAQLRKLAGQLKVGADTRIALLSLWATMDRGRYRKLFLSPRMRPEDRAVFDDPHGNYLSDPAVLLADHLPAVQGALNLTADEIKLILGADFGTATLSLATVTLLDRHKVLAKGLKLSVADLLVLLELSGIDPFASPEQAVLLVETADLIKRAGLKVTQLNYLVRDAYDPAGPLAPRRDKVLALVRTLATEISRIRAEHAVPQDGLAFTDEHIGQKLPLVLPADVAATFLGMWTGTVAPDAAYFTANLVAPVGFADAADFAVLFPAAPPPEDPEALQTWQRNRRSHLAGLFLPFLQDRLIATMVGATLAGEFGTEPELTFALLTELLAVEGGPLLPAFAAANTHGFTLTYLDAGGAVLASELSADGTAAAGPAGTASLTLTGAIEVSTPGQYAFAAAPGATLTLSHLTDALTAQADGSFEPVMLEAGTSYELAVTIAGPGPAQLSVLAENLPLGPAGRLTVRPSATIATIATAHELIRKALLLADALDFGVTELRHLHLRGTDFGGWNLSAPAFAPLLRLCAVALVREELRADGTEIIHIFREARRVAQAGETAADVREDVLSRIATLTRRTAETVSEAADVLGFADPADFADERALTRVWRLLTLSKTLGVAPATVASWADPAPGEARAAQVRTTLKARFEPSAWRATVKPISDRLRRLRRDALVAHLMDRDGFASLEQLFEHFLVDPGTEPVVQTSRLRLAISSMQTFIQRCLMNLEPAVRPAALSSTQWEWMKRYRVWEANRKIFLWPENWLEPEFRDDKSHLFRALEGELLQGDVSQDLAEDALYTYLSGLDKIARLEIVSTWLQEHELDPGNNILHVVGRTYHKPNEYFYRRFLSGEWTPWEPIAASIESDHVVVTVWRQRPYLFWLTFLERAQEPEGDDFSGVQPNPPRIVDVQLSWAEYVNGQWSAAEASDLNRPLSAVVSPSFTPRSVFVHAKTTVTEDEDTVSIYLTSGGAKAQQGNQTLPSAVALHGGFKLVGRNAPLLNLSTGPLPVSPPFSWDKASGTQYHSDEPLTVWYTQKIEKFQGKTTVTKDPKLVLTKGTDFSLVTPPARVNTTGSTEIDSLVRPFFYQDDRHTFFVEPTVTEQVFHEWDDWIVATPSGPGWHLDDDLVWQEAIPIQPWAPLIDPTPTDPISPYAIFALQDINAVADVVLAPTLTVQFGESLIGAEGAVNG